MLFRSNPDLINELLDDDEFKRNFAKEVEPARKLAEQYAPSIMPRSGSRQVEIVTDDDGVALVNTDYGGHLAEWGSSKNPPSAPLRRGILGAGLRLEETPK